MRNTANGDRTPLLNGCEFCDEFAGGISNAFYARYRQNLPSRFILATENFRVFPSIGQLVEGYLLITPVRHYCAMDEMPPDVLAEFVNVYEDVKTVASNTYGPCLFYEHGARDPRYGGGCGIYHAHLHVVPFDGFRDPLTELKHRFAYKPLQRFNDILTESQGLVPYLLYEDMESNRYLFSVGALPSQYMRQLLAEILGRVDWDWHSAGREERLLSTMNRLAKHFETLRLPVAPQGLANDDPR